jgi:hypothetical protein
VQGASTHRNAALLRDQRPLHDALRRGETRELERAFFGTVDLRGKAAVEYFSGFNHTSASGCALEDLMLYMSTQKLRTPKGLDWLVARTGAGGREDVLNALRLWPRGAERRRD